METVRVHQGVSTPFRLTINDSLGVTFGDYTLDTLLAGTVRTGTDRTGLFSFTPTWLDPARGEIEFTILGSETQALPVGQYLLQVTLADKNADLCEALLEVGYSPGASLELPVYCSYQDILNDAPWVALLQNPDTDDSGFMQVRAQARQDIDSAIMASYRGGGGGQFGSHSDAGFAWGGGGVQPSDYVRDLLTDNKLMAGSDPTKKSYRPKVKKMAVYRSIAIIGLRQITLNPQHVAAGASFQNLFLQELTSYTAEIDTNGSGSASIVIPCSVTNTVFT